MTSLHPLPLVLPLSSVDRSMINLVGGKAANLGDMIQSPGHHIPVPGGFAVTAEAFRVFFHLGLTHVDTKDELKALIGQLESLDDTTDLDTIRDVGGRLRATLSQVPMPMQVANAVETAWKLLEDGHRESHKTEAVQLAVAVRSSATAEDLPTASFAGQQDTYLNVLGYKSVQSHIKSCWISLFTDRAIAYRLKQKFSHFKCYLCVVVQKQIDPVVSGIMFTADAVTGRRNVTVIDAGFGLGETLVSGLINPDEYKYDRKNNILEKQIGDQQIEMIPANGDSNAFNESSVGGTRTEQLEVRRRTMQKLTNAQIDTLVEMGKEIQKHYNGFPQDIEWCIERGTNKLYVVQSRPITTLFPLPEGALPDDDLNVYVSFAHVQVMMDPIRPCGRSIWKRFHPFGSDRKRGKKSTIMTEAGCFLYVNPTRLLQVPLLGKAYLRLAKKGIENIAVSLAHVAERDAFRSSTPSGSNIIFVLKFISFAGPLILKMLWTAFFKPNPEGVASSKSAFIDGYVARVRSRVRSGNNSRENLLAGLQEFDVLYKGVFQTVPYAFAGFLSIGLLKRLASDHADQQDLDAIGRGLSGNVTTDMDLAIGDLADLARKEPKITEWLKEGNNLTLDGLYNLASDEPLQFRAAFQAFLDRYGSRANSEIDISRPRWRDDPSSIFQVIRGNITNEEEGHHRKYHQQLVKSGEDAAQRIISSVPWYKRPFVRRFIRTGRALTVLREHHKFLMIRVLDEIRLVILEIASTLVGKGYLESKDDIWFLTAEEIVDSLDWNKEELQEMVARRRELHEIHSKFKPPTVLTSEGECVNIHPNSGHITPGALPGLGVSSGIVEGVAKVVTDPTTAVLHSGEILVAPCTDPGWTPLFINASGVVMEVGGYLTHGSVVSREYNLPAVSCVENATTVIKTGMRIRVNGTDGFVEIL